MNTNNIQAPQLPQTAVMPCFYHFDVNRRVYEKDGIKRNSPYYDEHFVKIEIIEETDNEYIYQILNNNKMSPKEKASEIYESMSNELSKHIFNGHHDIAIILSEKQAKEVLESFNEYYPYSIETKDMEWTSDDSWLFNLYKDFWNNVIKEIRLLA